MLRDTGTPAVQPKALVALTLKKFSPLSIECSVGPDAELEGLAVECSWVLLPTSGLEAHC